MVRSRLLKLTEVKRPGCQAIIINKSLDNFTNSPINETSLPSCPPGFWSSDLTHPFTSPPLKGGEKECSPHPSPIGEGDTLPCNYNFNLKRTYRLKNKHSSRFTLHSSLKKNSRVESAKRSHQSLLSFA